MPSAKSTYASLITDRQHYLREAYDSACLTIPALIPEEVDALNRRTTGVELPKPWQSLGARGVNNLAAKLLLALLPPTGSFFRYDFDQTILDQVEASQLNEIQTDIQQRLAARERAVMQEINATNIRTKAFLALKHLVVAGNVLMYLPPEGGARVFPLYQYGVRRDFLGHVLELVYVEILDRDSVPPNVAEVLDESQYAEAEGDARRKDKPVHLYTHVVRKGKRYHAQQEVDGKVVPGSKFSVRIEDSPWLVLRWTAIDGEDYGRGHVEEYRGDLRGLEELSKALVKASLNAAKLVPLIDPGATITPRRLVQAENGEPLMGRAGDVTFLQQDKQADMAVARAQRQDLEQALSSDFLLASSFQRNAERVTAEEIRVMAQELEDTLGGVYSVQSQELQLPLARRIEAQLVRRGALPKLGEDLAKISVVTGLAAIGRGQDLNRLREGVGMVAELGNVFPQAVQYINPGDLVKRIFIGVGVDVDGLLKTDEQIAQEQQAAQRQALLAQGLSGAAPAAGKAGVEALADRARMIREQEGAEGGAPQQ